MMNWKICQVLPRLQSGGVERGTLEIAAALIKAQQGAYVVSEGGRLVEPLMHMGGAHFTLPVAQKNPWQIYRNITPLKNYFENTGINLVHVRSRAPAWSAIPAARACNLPLITTYHGTYTASNPLKRYYNRIMTRGDFIIAPSHFIAAHILKEHGAHLASRIRVIHRGVDPTYFDPQTISPEQIQAQRHLWNAPSNALVFLLPGRLTRWKGHVEFLNAFAELRTLLIPRPCYGVLVGEFGAKKTYLEELRVLIQKLGLETAVMLTDYTRDMPVAYASADIVMAPSLEPEAFGRVMAEAQAMGKCVIAAKHGGAVEIIEEGITGFLSPAGNVPALTEVMHHAACLPEEKLDFLAQKARERMLALFTIEKMQHATLALYQEVLERQ